MASITFSGQLDQAMNEAAAEGNKILFIPQQTVGEVLPGAASELVVESDGTYSITLAYNTYSIYHYSDVTKKKTLIANSVVVSADTAVSTIPDLIGSTVPVTEDSVLTIQGYLTDAQDSAEAAANSETNAAASEAAVTNRVAAYEVETTEYLISTFDGSALEVGDVVRTLGYYTAGDGGGAEWVKTGEAGTASQSPAELLLAKLSTFNGDVYSIINDRTISPKCLGAYCDGINLDDSAIQAGINTLSDLGGGVIHLNQAQWAMTGVEILSDGISIKGLGRSATNITCFTVDGITSAACFSFGQSVTGSGELTAVSGCSISGMTIYGNRDGGHSGSGLRVTVFENLHIEDVVCTDFANNYGFGIVGTGYSPRSKINVVNCAAHRCGADGLDIKAGAEHIYIENFESSAHLDETDGDSVGLDIRGQYVTVVNPHIYDCVEIGLRVRVNSGEYADDDSWDTAKNARVDIYSPTCHGNRDNIAINSNEGSEINLFSARSREATRYGLSVSGVGCVKVIGGSATENLVGVNIEGDCNVALTNFDIIENTQDGLTGNDCKSLTLTGCNVSDNTRYGIRQGETGPDSNWCLTNVKMDGNVIHFFSDSESMDGLVEFLNCSFTNASSRAFQVPSSSLPTYKFNGGSMYENYANLYSYNEDTYFTGVKGFKTKNSGVDSFSVTSATIVTVQVTHNLDVTPSSSDILLSLERDTNVNDYEIGFVRVSGISSTIFNVQVNVTEASSTTDAVANLVWRVEVKAP